MEIDVEPSSRPVALRLGNIARRLLTHNGRAYLLARRTREAVRFPPSSRMMPISLRSDCSKTGPGCFSTSERTWDSRPARFRIFHDAPILSIEPNPEHRRDLRLLQRLIRRFDFLMIAAGEDNGWANLRIPMTVEQPHWRGDTSRPGFPGEYWTSPSPGRR